MSRPDPFGPVIGLDIDGTSGDYHAHFTWFAEQYTGKPMPRPTDYTGGVPFHKHLGISRKTYNDIKLAYRQGGLKRFMPVYRDIGGFTRAVRKRGVQVWIATTRPYLNLSNIDPDTRHWLTKRAYIQYDGLLYGAHKYRDLIGAVGRDRIVCVYDDLPSLTTQADTLGLRAILRAQPYNEGHSGNAGVAYSVDAMWELFKVEHQRWKDEHGK